MIAALLGLRAKLAWRRLTGARRLGAVAVALFGAAAGGTFSFALCALILERGRELGRDPSLAAHYGALSVFASWLTFALLGRVWFALLSLGQQAFFDPRRFRGFPVPARLISAINLAALFADPLWLFLYPPLAVIAVAVSRLPAAPALWALLVAELFAIWATVGALHLAAAVGAAFEARPMLRRSFTVGLLALGLAVFQLKAALPQAAAAASWFAGDRVRPFTPPGWAAVLARDLSRHHLLHALGPLALLFLCGLLGSVAAHALSKRNAIRPPEPVRARARGAGLRLPFLPEAFSALFEKEAKTVARAGWLQLVLVPVAYLLLMRAFTGAQPLLVAAVYAQLGVLEIATNAFGRDLLAARGYFLWPVSLRQLLAAKNAVACCFSAAIFALLALLAWTLARVSAAQVLVALLAHLSIFPLVATFGNAVSVLFPLPVRGVGLRRVRGMGPLGARLFLLALLSGAAWAPYWISQVTGLQLFAAYAGACAALWIAYLALLGACARLLESRREPLLSALSRDE